LQNMIKPRKGGGGKAKPRISLDRKKKEGPAFPTDMESAQKKKKKTPNFGCPPWEKKRKGKHFFLPGKKGKESQKPQIP